MKRIFNKIPTLKEVVKGIDITLDNANDLQSTSKLLFRKKKYNHASSFTLAAKQELGKVKVLHYMTMYISANKHESKTLSKAFFAHLDKIVLSDVIESTIKNTTTIREILKIAAGEPVKSIKHENEQLNEETFRQRCLYVDYNEELKKWHQPSSISMETTGELIENTQAILKRILREKEEGFYGLDYYKFIDKYQTPLFLKYIDNEGELQIPENELEVLQDYWREVLSKAQIEGIIKKGFNFDREF
jgi:AbiV family abortive infection protein